MATQYAYDKFVLHSIRNILVFGKNIVRKDNPKNWDAHISFVKTIMRMPPRWGKATKKHAELMNGLRSYWRNKWFNKTIPEIKKIILELTLIPEDVINMLPKYFTYPYQTKPAYVGHVRWFQDIDGMWCRYDCNGTSSWSSPLDELWKDQEGEWRQQAHLGGLYFQEAMERLKEHRAAKRELRRQVSALVSKRAKGWDRTARIAERDITSGGSITHRRWWCRARGRRQWHGRGRRYLGRRGGGGGGAVHVGLKN